MNNPKIDTKELARFLVKAKTNAWAADEKEIEPQRPGFKELEFNDGDWNYRDSYTGYFCAPGQEIVRYQNIPVWAMAYDGGMAEPFMEDRNLAKKTFAFLKRALMSVTEEEPFRGPSNLKDGAEWIYSNRFLGDIERFKGEEKIMHNGSLVFSQNYIGGLILHK